MVTPEAKLTVIWLPGPERPNYICGSQQRLESSSSDSRVLLRTYITPAKSPVTASLYPRSRHASQLRPQPPPHSLFPCIPYKILQRGQKERSSSKRGVINSNDLHRFEWIYGLDNRSFPFSGEENTVTVHKDLIYHIKERKLAISPATSLASKALTMMNFNTTVKSNSDRQRFEDFGSGPWEYVLFVTKGMKALPPLFHRSLDGSTAPLSLDESVSDYNALPRFTSMIHPLVVIFFRLRNPIGSHCVEKSLEPHVIAPITRVFLEWPLWTHNRFLPMLTSPKRKRPGASDTCGCSDCEEWEYSESSTSGSSSQADSSEDSESWRDPVPVEEVIKDDARVKDWSLQAEGPSEGDGSDPILEQYSREPSPPVSFTLGRLEEAMGLRLERLQPILEAAKHRLSEKRSKNS
ncbi:hypothetical protein E1B28_002900 [Marasmius oreades]|uniref:Uncharacterized protein n=1 Tax=Marasmius oreades TaxID=181124 RepID=A0A9P7RJR1_9AGAR|nr:uncharacterized protein E1B28_002900 [Marasmius oreades]KAG7085334.1 hypothetical protein E1B28_002900 [Marasmius oreades]